MTFIKKSEGEAFYIPPVIAMRMAPGYWDTRTERVCTSHLNPNYKPKMSDAEIAAKDEEVITAAKGMGYDAVRYSTGGGSKYIYECKNVERSKYVPASWYQEIVAPGFYAPNKNPGWNAGARSAVSLAPGDVPPDEYTYPESAFFFTFTAEASGVWVWMTEGVDDRVPTDDAIFALRATAGRLEVLHQGVWHETGYTVPSYGETVAIILRADGFRVATWYYPPGNYDVLGRVGNVIGDYAADIKGRAFYLRVALYLAGDFVSEADYHSGGGQVNGCMASLEGFATDTTYGGGKGILAALDAIGGVYSRGGEALATLQSIGFEGGGTGGGQLPSLHGSSTGMYGTGDGGGISWHLGALPSICISGLLYSGHPASQLRGSLAAVVAFAHDSTQDVSGQAYGLLPPIAGAAFGTEGDGLCTIADYALGLGRMQAATYVVVVLNSRGQLAAVFDAQTILGADLLSKAQVRDSIAGDMSLLAYIDSVVRGADGLQGQSFTGGGQAPNPGQQMPGGTEDYDGGYFVWVFNARTGAVSRYLRYGFDSFAQIGGHHFGVAEDGVYLLEGDTDAGQRIEARAGTGLLDLGAKELKHVSAVYLDAASDGVLSVRVQAGQQQYTYQARRASQHNAQQRVDTGRGLRATHYSFELLNGGADFELDAMDVNVAKSARRI